MMDKIIIKDIRCLGILGINPEERVTPQPILVNIVLDTHTHKAAHSKNIDDTVNYFDIATRVKAYVEEAQALLVETLVNNLADLILNENPMVGGVLVRVEKPEAVPFATSVGIEIMRRRR
ncbi:MAG: dihydroneopterin aldolase [Chloroflexota bacterium]